MVDSVTNGRVKRIMQTLNKAAEICEIDIGALMAALQREYVIQARAVVVNHDGLIEIKKSRPRPSEWARAEKLWAEGDSTMNSIASRLGVSVQSVHRHMQRRGIKKGSDCCVFESVMEAANGGRDEVCQFLGI